MEAAKNALFQDLARPVEKLTDTQAEAVLGGIPAIQKVREAAGRIRPLEVKMTDVLVSS